MGHSGGECGVQVPDRQVRNGGIVGVWPHLELDLLSRQVGGGVGGKVCGV